MALSNWAGLAAVASLASVLFSPRSAEACSCRSDRHGGSDAAAAVSEAEISSDAVFIGHVLKSTGPDRHGGYAHGTAVLRVTELFKGDVRVGAEVSMPAGDDSGDCSLIYEPKTDVLVYARRDGDGLTAGFCSRTRTLTSSAPDPEVEYLRGPNGPRLRPVALQRERVHCQRCNVSTVGLALAGLSYPGCCGAEKEAISESIAKKRPFWAGGRYEYGDAQHVFAVGLGKDGSAFQLVETLAPYPDAACTGRVERRSCRTLTPAGDAATCVSPGVLSAVCDEAAMKEVSVAEPEAIGSTNCRWRGVTNVMCELPATPIVLPPDAATWPRLICSPERPKPWENESREFICNVVEDPSLKGDAKPK